MAATHGTTSETVDAFAKLYEAGIGYNEIGKQFGLTGKCVRYHLAKRGVQTRESIHSDVKSEIIKMYESNVPTPDIAQRFGMSEWNVAYRLKSWGIKLRGSKRRHFVQRLNITEEEVVRKYAELKDINDVAALYRVTDTTIRTLLNKHGVKSIPDERINRVYREKDEIHRLYYEMTFSLDEIAILYEISLSCMSNKFREWSWKTREMTVGDTSIERAIAAMLDAIGVTYEKQFKLGFKYFDLCIPAYRLLIEANGDYWHGNPAVYDESGLDRTQLASRERDRVKTRLAAQKGYRLLFFWERDIKANPTWVQTEILNAIQKEDAA